MKADAGFLPFGPCPSAAGNDSGVITIAMPGILDVPAVLKCTALFIVQERDAKLLAKGCSR